jgi:hypothetical protein
MTENPTKEHNKRLASTRYIIAAESIFSLGLLFNRKSSLECLLCDKSFLLFNLPEKSRSAGQGGQKAYYNGLPGIVGHQFSIPPQGKS